MLVNCPRCGFSQPKDQYCAQCGVDMQAYKPKEKPFFSRLLESTGLQVGILVLATVFVGQYILRSEKPQNWVQKMSPFQGVSRSEKTKATSGNRAADESHDSFYQGQNSDSASEGFSETGSNSDSAFAKNEMAQNRNWAGSGRDRENLAGRSGGGLAGSQGSDTNGNALPAGVAQDLSSLGFKVTYVEVTTEMLAKWIADSSALGLYQALPEYSAGIVYDFRKKGDSFQQLLKSSDLKINVGNANSNISGVMAEDGVQMIGLVASVEYRSNENESIHGNINVSKTSQQGTESYPAEFSLPKGAAFFIVGVVKRDSFINDRTKLNMPPFQIFKSPDFMTRKTEFVIILEHDYK